MPQFGAQVECSSPTQWTWAYGVNKPLKSVLHGQCNARPTRVTDLPSRRASPPFGRYQIVLLGDRGTWVVATCPELLRDGAPAGS